MPTVRPRYLTYRRMRLLIPPQRIPHTSPKDRQRIQLKRDLHRSPPKHSHRLLKEIVTDHSKQIAINHPKRSSQPTQRSTQTTQIHTVSPKTNRACRASRRYFFFFPASGSPWAPRKRQVADAFDKSSTPLQGAMRAKPFELRLQRGWTLIKRDVEVVIQTKTYCLHV